MSKGSEDRAPVYSLSDGERAELAILLADERLRVSPRNRAFLKYIAEAAIDGRAQGVKGYSIAVDVFGRNENFDASADPIVRIEASRLRNALEQYYVSFGLNHLVQVSLPRGGYKLEFTTRPEFESEVYKIVATYNRYQFPVRGALPATTISSSKAAWLTRCVAYLQSSVLRF